MARRHRDKYASKAPKRPRTCTTASGAPKHAYDREQAREVADAMRANGRAPRAYAYDCNNCAWWHVAGGRPSALD